MKQSTYAKLFEGLNVAGAVLTFLAAGVAIASTTRVAAGHPYLLPAAIIVFVGGQMLIVAAAPGLSRKRLDLKSAIALMGLYTLLSFLDVISIAIGLPFILVTMVLGPLTTAVFVLASVVLGIYVIEEIIGYDLQGRISILESPLQAFIALMVWIGSLLILVWDVGTHGDAEWVMERAADLIFNLRKAIQETIDSILQKEGSD